MNFIICLKNKLVAKLQAIAKREKVSRNNSIGRSIEGRESSSWGEEVLAWKGCPEFELPLREDLRQPSEEIL